MSPPKYQRMFFFILQTLYVTAQGQYMLIVEMKLFRDTLAGGHPVPDAGQWRAAVYEHQLVTPASAGCTERTCTREEAVQVRIYLVTNENVLFAPCNHAR